MLQKSQVCFSSDFSYPNGSVHLIEEDQDLSFTQCGYCSRLQGCLLFRKRRISPKFRSFFLYNVASAPRIHAAARKFQFLRKSARIEELIKFKKSYR